MMWLIVSSVRIFLNNDWTSYDTSSSSSRKDEIEDNMIGNLCASLMEHSELDTSFATLYVNVPVWSIIRQNFRWATVISYKVSNL